MHGLLYLTTGFAFLSQFAQLSQVLGPASRILKLSPEFFSVVLLCLIVLTIARNKELALAPKYIFFALILVFQMFLGGILNTVSPGAFAWGLRTFFAFVPLFLLPMVYPFSDREIHRFFKFVLVLCLLQMPVSVYQRLFVYGMSGDAIKGTFPSGAIMSIVLVYATGTMIVLYLRKKVSGVWLTFCVPVLLIPTLINETKGTAVLLPIVLCLIAYFFAEPAQRLRVVLLSGLASIVFVIGFSVAYDVYFPQKGKGGESFILLTFFTEEAFDELYKDLEEPKPGRVGRVDSILYALEKITENPMTAAFGLGTGNVPNPETIDFLRGKHTVFYEYYGANTTTYASLLWTIGIVGVIISMLILLALYRDATSLREGESYRSAVMLSCSVIFVTLPVSFLYKDLLYANVASVLGFFLAGYAAAQKMRMSTYRSISPPQFVSNAALGVDK